MQFEDLTVIICILGLQTNKYGRKQLLNKEHLDDVSFS